MRRSLYKHGLIKLLTHVYWSHSRSQGRPLAAWTDCIQSGPAPKGAPSYTYKRTQTYTCNRSCLYSADPELTVFFKGGAHCQQKSEMRGFERPQHSFFTRNNGHCFSAMCGLVSWIAAMLWSCFLLQLHLTGQVSIVAAKYDLIVIVSSVTVLLLVFWWLTLVRDCECVLLSQSYSISLSQPEIGENIWHKPGFSYSNLTLLQVVNDRGTKFNRGRGPGAGGRGSQTYFLV